MKQTFLAEIRKVESRKLVTNDVEIRLLLNTNDRSVLDLGKLPPDQIVRVTVEDGTPDERPYIPSPIPPSETADNPLPWEQNYGAEQ